MTAIALDDAARVAETRKSLRLFESMCELYVQSATTKTTFALKGSNMRKFLAVLLLPFFMLTVAAAANSSSKPTATQNRSAVSDAQIESIIRAKLAKSKIGKDGFRFHVQRGVVTWDGATAVGQHKGAATRMARTSGAVEVINNIRVSGAGKETPLRKAAVQP